jgi:transposase InsO family protein
MCRALGVSRNGYHAWRKRTPGPRARANQVLLAEIKKIHQLSRQTYGSPRITKALRRKGFRCSRPRVARIMRKNNIYAKTKRKFKVTTNSKHKYSISPNLITHTDGLDGTNKVWASDITYIRTKAGWLYLTVILDLFNRQIVGWSMSKRLTAATTTIPALLQAYRRHRPYQGLIFHSDRGVQYACDAFRKLLSKYKFLQSMSGSCYDNSVVESFFHTLKTEHVYFETYETREQARLSIFEYIEVFYNRQRMHTTLGDQTPVEFAELKKAA